MKKYETPQLEEELIELEDIIASSTVEGHDGGDQEGGWQPSNRSWWF